MRHSSVLGKVRRVENYGVTPRQHFKRGPSSSTQRHLPGKMALSDEHRRKHHTEKCVDLAFTEMTFDPQYCSQKILK